MNTIVDADDDGSININARIKFSAAGQFQCALSFFQIHTGTDTDGSQLIFGRLFLVSVEKLAAIVLRNTGVEVNPFC